MGCDLIVLLHFYALLLLEKISFLRTMFKLKHFLGTVVNNLHSCNDVNTLVATGR